MTKLHYKNKLRVLDESIKIRLIIPTIIVYKQHESSQQS